MRRRRMAGRAQGRRARRPGVGQARRPDLSIIISIIVISIVVASIIAAINHYYIITIMIYVLCRCSMIYEALRGNFRRWRGAGQAASP